jgi:hypothetical protein
MSQRERKKRASSTPTAPLAVRAPPTPPIVVDAEPVGTPALLAKLLPELVVVAIALAFALIPHLQTAEAQEILTAVAFVEFGFCIVQGTLTDLATRLRNSPPAWLAIALAVGCAVFALANARGLAELARDIGWAMLLGVLWSGAERLRELWTMPKASRAEKLRRRALVGGRIELVLAVGAVTMLIVGATYLHDDTNGGFRALDGYLPWFVAAYFSLTAIDVWRVHRPVFLLRPRSLLRIDPLGIEYLLPV